MAEESISLCDEDHALEWKKARRRALDFSVIFSTETRKIETLEGPVQCSPGDAVITGIHGEEWPVGKERFQELYEPVPPTKWGEDGMYRRLPLAVDAAEITDECSFTLPGKRGSVKAQAGDWLVRQPDGGMGVVAKRVFDETYILDSESL